MLLEPRPDTIRPCLLLCCLLPPSKGILCLGPRLTDNVIRSDRPYVVDTHEQWVYVDPYSPLPLIFKVTHSFLKMPDPPLPPRDQRQLMLQVYATDHSPTHGMGPPLSETYKGTPTLPHELPQCCCLAMASATCLGNLSSKRTTTVDILLRPFKYDGESFTKNMYIVACIKL